MRKKLHLIGLSLLCILAGISPAYAESSKWIELTADIPSDIVFENEISVELQNCQTGENTVLSCTPYDDYTSRYYIEPGEYEVISADIAGSFDGELTVEYPEDTISITDDSPEVTTLPLTVSVGPASSASEDSAGSAEEDIDLSEVNEAPTDGRRKDIMASLCFTLGLLCVTGAAFLIVKSRRDID